jgi:hypothetical protein
METILFERRLTMSTPATAPTEAEIVKWMTEKPWIRKELGEYEKPCLDFVERVSQLDGVIVIGALPTCRNVELWTLTDREDRALETAIIKSFAKVVRNSDVSLLFDFMMVSEKEHFPQEAIVLYQKKEE